MAAGVRTAWLYFDQSSSRALEEAGFRYDSTHGYNDAVGFRSGTLQVFRPLGASQLLELPLVVMDSALFYPTRMGVSEAEALEACARLIDQAAAHGGVLTINWHTRSLQPERNWDAFYLELLALLKQRRVWFATASQATGWFSARRRIRFESADGPAESLPQVVMPPAATPQPSFVTKVTRTPADRRQAALSFQ